VSAGERSRRALQMHRSLIHRDSARIMISGALLLRYCWRSSTPIAERIAGARVNRQAPPPGGTPKRMEVSQGDEVWNPSLLGERKRNPAATHEKADRKKREQERVMSLVTLRINSQSVSIYISLHLNIRTRQFPGIADAKNKRRLIKHIY